ncbi:MAG: phosphoribosylamine--glycine ligase, partial [bacterium]
MKILVVGGGGREHALVWKLKQSPLCRSIVCAPGNAGIGRLAELAPIGAEAVEEQVQFAVERRFDLVVIGPEAPLAAGLADALRAKDLRVFGPSRAAARIESSKIFARRLMEKYGIPSPVYQAFENPEAAKSFVRELAFQGKRCVVKADGLAAGKGAIVTSNPEEA